MADLEERSSTEDSMSDDNVDNTDQSDDSVKNMEPMSGHLTPASGSSQSSDKDGSFVLPRADKNYQAKQVEYRSKRLEFLLKQSEVFSHFMTNGLTLKDSGGHRTRKRKLKIQAIEDIESMTNSADSTKAIFRFEKTPEYIENGDMRDYQIAGLNWMVSLMENGINGILADEMGLGKTLQTISLLGFMKHVKGETNPHLVIAPLSTLANWMNEIKRWCPSLKALCLAGTAEERSKTVKQMTRQRFDVLVTAYHIILMEKGTIKKIAWNYIVVDEAQRIKNENTQLAQTVRQLSTTHRLLLTGTPLNNNLHELWSLLNFLLPEVFDSSEDFDTWFDSNACLDNQSLVKRLHQLLQPFLLRRIKSEVEKGLPPKIESKVFVDLAPMQVDWYAKILKKELSRVVGDKITRVRLLNILMHLRKVTNHPYLFEGAEPGPPYTTDEHLLTNCGKLAELDRLLTKLKAEGHRVLLFCQMVRMMDILEDYCVWRNFDCSRLDGNTKIEERQKSIDEFNAPGCRKFLFLISTRAGGLGINLTSADCVILYDSDWNPQADLQAIDRAHRIGQTKPVYVYRMITRNTVEEKIVERAEQKLKLDQEVIQKGRHMFSDEVRLGKTDVQVMIEHGAQEIIQAAEARQALEVTQGRSRRRR